MASKLTIDPLTLMTLPALFAAANADKHRIISPSHVALRDGQPVGCFGVFLPTLFFWSDSKNSARDTVTLIQAAEKAGGHAFVAPCQPDSPMHPLMKRRAGWELLGNADLFLVNR